MFKEIGNEKENGLYLNTSLSLTWSNITIYIEPMSSNTWFLVSGEIGGFSKPDWFMMDKFSV